MFSQAEGVNGDLEKAFTHLRKTGKSKATSMAHRTATEGLVGLKVQGSRAVLVEVNSETDFVARNERFQAFVADVAATAFAAAAQSTAAGSSALSVSELLAATVPGKGLPLSDALADLIGAIRENIAVRRAVQLTVSPSSGTIGVYVHGSVAPGMGRAAALVGLHTDTSTTEDSSAALQAAGKPIAMHCVAAQPRFLNRAEVPDAVLAKERSISVSCVCVCYHLKYGALSLTLQSVVLVVVLVVVVVVKHAPIVQIQLESTTCTCSSVCCSLKACFVTSSVVRLSLTQFELLTWHVTWHVCRRSK
jgi:translation elongation factor Ts